MTPPAIHHINSIASDDRRSLASLCSQALHMGKGETAMLAYYATRSEGFRPAAQTVCKETGLSRMQVFRMRDKLCEHGVALINSGSLILDWKRIRTFASLDAAMTSKRCVCAPVRAKKGHYTIYIPNSVIVKLESCSVEQVVKILGAMTEQQFQAIRRYYGKVWNNEKTGRD